VTDADVTPFPVRDCFGEGDSIVGPLKHSTGLQKEKSARRA